MPQYHYHCDFEATSETHEKTLRIVARWHVISFVNSPWSLDRNEKHSSTYVSLQEGPFHLNELCMLVATCRKKKGFCKQCANKHATISQSRACFYLISTYLDLSWKTDDGKRGGVLWLVSNKRLQNKMSPMFSIWPVHGATPSNLAGTNMNTLLLATVPYYVMYLLWIIWWTWS